MTINFILICVTLVAAIIVVFLWADLNRRIDEIENKKDKDTELKDMTVEELFMQHCSNPLPLVNKMFGAVSLNFLIDKWQCKIAYMSEKQKNWVGSLYEKFQEHTQES